MSSFEMAFLKMAYQLGPNECRAAVEKLIDTQQEFSTHSFPDRTIQETEYQIHLCNWLQETMIAKYR